MDCFVLLLSSIRGYGAGEIVRFEYRDKCSEKDLAFVENQKGSCRVCYGYDIEPTETIVAVRENLP